MKEIKEGSKAAQVRELRERRFEENQRRLQQQVAALQRSQAAPRKVARFGAEVKAAPVEEDALAPPPPESDPGEWRDLEAEARAARKRGRR